MNLTVLAGAVVLAIILEKLFEAIFTPLWDHFKWDTFYKLYAAIVVGTAVGMLTGLNAVPTLFVAAPVAGRVLTALFIGCGPSFIYDLVDGLPLDKTGYIFEDTSSKPKAKK